MIPAITAMFASSFVRIQGDLMGNSVAAEKRHHRPAQFLSLILDVTGAARCTVANKSRN
jgi:hypothetical protein